MESRFWPGVGTYYSLIVQFGQCIVLTQKHFVKQLTPVLQTTCFVLSSSCGMDGGVEVPWSTGFGPESAHTSPWLYIKPSTM